MADVRLTKSNPGRIVVGYDGSSHSRAALSWAAALAARDHAHLSVIAVWDGPSFLGAPVTLSNHDPRQELSDVLNRDLSALGLGQGQVDSAVEQGRPAKVLIDASREADLLVVGRRGCGGFEHLMLGSVSSQCVAHAACTVCVIPG